MNRAHALPLLGFAVLLALLGTGLTLNPREIPSALIGRAMPSFSLPTLEMPAQTLDSSTLRGPLLLNVWASWCRQCAREHPLLMRLAAGRDIPVYGLNYKDSIGKARAFLQRNGNPYAATALDMDGRTGMDFGVYGVPETYVIDADGRILFRHVGALTNEIVSERIEPLLEARRDGV